ncbi:MAG: hypothetical protein HGB02_07215 [Chlorobiaceae bacterium]|nr:hypothetical protein [Chlorobiaceae bacterium]
MEQVIEFIEAGSFEAAAEAVKGLKSGIEWNYGDDDGEPTDAEYWSDAQCGMLSSSPC